MRLAEMFFTDWYHKYVTIEVDDLTELLKDSIKIHDDDCYALCSSYCNAEGFVLLNVLAVGSSWEKCNRGLKSKKMLGTFSIDMVLNSETRLVEPDQDMMYKNEDFLKRMDEDTDEEKSYQIVGEVEANIEAGLLNVRSPLARALIGKDEGDSVDVVTPGGTRSYEILSIRYI